MPSGFSARTRSTQFILCRQWWIIKVICSGLFVISIWNFTGLSPNLRTVCGNFEIWISLQQENLQTPFVDNSRRVGCRLPWIIPFDAESVRHSKIPEAVLVCADFAIQEDAVHPGNLKYFLVEPSSYVAAGLKYCYKVGHRRWITYLESKFAAKMQDCPRHERLGITRPAWNNR